MEIVSPQSPLVPSLPPDRKKIYYILGGILVVAVILIPLLIGYLTPTKKVVPTTVTTGTGTKPTISGETHVATSPLPSLKPGEPTAAVTPYFQTAPVPTLDLDTLISVKPNQPTPTPLPGPFYINNGKQNDLFIRLYQEKDWDQFYQVQLINAKTHETRAMGYQYLNAPGDSAFFSHDFKEVIFLGGSKKDLQNLSYYSIPNNTVIHSVTLNDMKSAIPELALQPAKTLSRLAISPDGGHAAMSYGYTYYVTTIDPTTDIIIINLTTRRIAHLSAHGLVRDWKDNNTLEYETNSTDPGTNTVTEVPVPNY